MLKLIAILVLSSTLSVAVETDKGYIEREFPNTMAGANELVDFVEKTVGEPEDGVRVVVGSPDKMDGAQPILKVLNAAGVTHGIVSPADLQSAVVTNGLTGPTAKAVALADEKRFGFMYRRKKK